MEKLKIDTESVESCFKFMKDQEKHKEELVSKINDLERSHKMIYVNQGEMLVLLKTQIKSAERLEAELRIQNGLADDFDDDFDEDETEEDDYADQNNVDQKLEIDDDDDDDIPSFQKLSKSSSNEHFSRQANKATSSKSRASSLRNRKESINRIRKRKRGDIRIKYGKYSYKMRIYLFA